MAHVTSQLEEKQKEQEREDKKSKKGKKMNGGDRKPKPTDKFKKSSRDYEKGKQCLMPTGDPQDILSEERRNNERRLERIEQRVEGVDKDW